MTVTENDILAAIERFDETTLLRLNQAIASRIKALRAADMQDAMAGFKPGDVVVFNNKQGVQVEGIVLKKNKKSISVNGFDESRYNVAPQLLTLRDVVDMPADVVGTPSNVVEMPGTSTLGGKPVISNEVEWLGGIVQTSGVVTGEGEPFKPVVLVWMNEERLIAGISVSHPDHVYAEAVAEFKKVTGDPMAESAMPTRIRIADAELAKRLSKAFTRLQVVNAPTPEIDEISESLDESMRQHGDARQSYLELSLPEPAIERFFQAAAALYEIKPWEVVPDESLIFGVTSADFGLKDAVICIIGQQRQDFGFILHDSICGYERFLACAQIVSTGHDFDIPPHIALNFESGSDVGDKQRKEVAKNNWPVADANAYPTIFSIDDDGEPRVINTRDLDKLEALCRALTAVCKQLTKTPAKTEAMWGGEHRGDFPISGTTYRGSYKLSMHFPFNHRRAYQASYPVGSALYDLLMLQDDISGYEEVDDTVYYQASDALTDEFHASAEGRPFRDERILSAVEPMHMMAFNYFGESIVTMMPGDVVQLLFEVFPAKAAISIENADSLFDSAVAFFTFLDRRYNLPQADACIVLIREIGVESLREALGDKSQFGMAKTIMAAAAEEGFDITRKEDIEAWMKKTGGRLPDSVELPDLPPHFVHADPELPTRSATKPKPADAKSRKKKRKASRKARRKK